MLPRVGQEVFVDFLDGDPDQPVVVGRAFNVVEPVVEKLPEHDTRSALRSLTIPNCDGWNEILLEDAKGNEFFNVRAQKDGRRLVKQDETATVVRDLDKEVKNDEVETVVQNRIQVTDQTRIELTDSAETVAIEGTRRDRVGEKAVERIVGTNTVRVASDGHHRAHASEREMIDYNAHLKIGGARQEAVGQTFSLTVGTDLSESVGFYAVSAEGPEAWIHYIADCKIVIDSATEVTLKGAGGFLKVDGGGVTIVGSNVVINEGGAPGSLRGVGARLPEKPIEAVVMEPARVR